MPKVPYTKAILISPFDKGKYIEGKLKILRQMDITLNQSEMETVNAFNTPRQIENFIRQIIKTHLH